MILVLVFYSINRYLALSISARLFSIELSNGSRSDFFFKVKVSLFFAKSFNVVIMSLGKFKIEVEFLFIFKLKENVKSVLPRDYKLPSEK